MPYYLIRHSQIQYLHIQTTFIHFMSSHRKLNDYLRYIEKQYYRYNSKMRHNEKSKLKRVFEFIDKYGFDKIEVLLIKDTSLQQPADEYIYI